MCGAVCGLVRYDVPILKLFDTRKVPKNRAEFVPPAGGKEVIIIFCRGV